MIVFHEGLPGAGKSYEACLFHILPALKQGRRVVTNIEGINLEKFSEHSGIPVPMLERFIVCIDHPEIKDIEEKCEAQKQSMLEVSGSDDLVVIDEIQDLFPTERQKLPTEWMNYIASHRHEGQDIILMGQCFRDIHAAWRRRTQRKIVFTKMTGVGLDNRYKWEAYEATTSEKFNKIASGTRNYEAQYFGLYASHTSGTENKTVYKDKRTVIWNTPLFRYVIPASVVVAYFAITHLIGFFSTPVASQEVQEVGRIEQQSTSQSRPGNDKNLDPLASDIPAKPVNQVPPPKPQYQAVDVFDELQNKYKPRLSGIVVSGDYLAAEIQILDSSFHVKDVFTAEQLVDMGWELKHRPAGLEMHKSNRVLLVRPWPVDSWGKVNKGRRSALSGPTRRVVASAPARSSDRGNPRAILVTHSPRPKPDHSLSR